MFASSGKKTLLTLFFLSIISLSAFAVQSEASMKIYAVTTDGEGLVATLYLEIEPGTGKIWSAVTPLVGTSTQNAERTAIKVAHKYYSQAGSYDYKFTIDSPASVVDGPSAGASMALLAVSSLLGKSVPNNVSMTGTISENGTVGPVGGIFEKAREAGKTGMKLFLIPRGEAVQTVKMADGVKSVNLIEYAPKNWNMKVVEVDTIDKAVQLANSDIADINVDTSSSSDAIPDFVPDKVPLSTGLQPVKLLTSNYLIKTKQETSEARNALSSTLLEDAEISRSLLEVLNSAEQTLDRAEILNEQNYLYSAANYAFLARVNAIIIKEVSNNPRLLQENSPDLDLKLYELRKELDNFANDLDENPSRSGAEWLASAQQRYTYAATTVERLTTQETILVGGTPDEKLQLQFKRVQDYAFAVAWLDVSKEFYALSKANDDYVKRPKDFSTSMDAPLSDAEKWLSELGDDAEREDLVRRIDSAKAEKDANWFEASYFDAVSARALLQSDRDANSVTEEELRAMLEAKIRAVEKEISASKTQAGWAELYLDHAKYFLASADYYQKNGILGEVSGGLKSGYGLAVLADAVFRASSQVNAKYATLPAAAKNEQATNGVTISVGNGSNKYALVAVSLFLLALILVLTVLIISITDKKRSRFSILKEISAAKKALKETDEKYLRGKIDRETHARLMEQHTNELAVLEAERRKKAMHMLAVDDFTSEISSYNERLRDLRKHLKEGVITSEEFSERSKEFLGKISELKEEVHREIDAIAKQETGLAGAPLAEDRLLPVALGKEELAVQKSAKAAKPAPARQKPAKKPAKKGGRAIRRIAKEALKGRK